MGFWGKLFGIGVAAAGAAAAVKVAQKYSENKAAEEWQRSIKKYCENTNLCQVNGK